jgi:DNA-directed RNA polymerase specialized sigma24 family protein
MALDIGEYIIDEPYHQYGDGYDQLEGDYAIYYKVATKFIYKAQAQDREDLLHTIILNLAVAHRNNGHKPDNPSWMYRIASFTVAQYWRDYYKRTIGVDCGHCSNQQRKKCKRDNLYSECPKAIKLEYLSKPIADSDGHLTELGELIADDKALNLAEWMDINTFLLGCPQRLIDIAEKIREGIPLKNKEDCYLRRFRRRERKSLF